MRHTGNELPSSSQHKIRPNTPAAKTFKVDGMPDVHDVRQSSLPACHISASLKRCANDGEAPPGAMPQVLSRPNPGSTLPLVTLSLEGLPVEIQSTIWRKLDLETRCTIDLVNRSIASSTSSAASAARLEKYVVSSSKKSHQVRLARLKLQWEKYMELPQDQRKGLLGALMSETWSVMIKPAATDAIHDSIADQYSIAAQAVQLALQEHFHDNADVFLFTACLAQRISTCRVNDLHPAFLCLSACTQATVFAKVKAGTTPSLPPKDLKRAMFSSISEWTKKEMATESFKGFLASALIDALPEYPIKRYRNQEWLKYFFSLTRGLANEERFNYQMLCRFIERLQLAASSIEPFISHVRLIKEHSVLLSPKLDACLRYKLRVLCACANRSDSSMQKLEAETNFSKFSHLNETAPTQKKDILLSALRSNLLNQTMGPWIVLFKELPQQQGFELLWSVKREVFDGLHGKIVEDVLARMTDLFKLFPEVLYARLCQKKGEWNDLSIEGFPGARIPSETLQRVANFSPTNRQIALSGLAGMIEYAGDSSAEAYAQLFFDLAEDLSAELRAKVAVAILQAQQARLRRISLRSYQNIARFGQILSGESAAAVSLELRVCQALMMEQARMATIEDPLGHAPAR